VARDEELELELELIQTRMIQKLLLWVEVGKSACVIARDEEPHICTRTRHLCIHCGKPQLQNALGREVELVKQLFG
jgi:hypothetical protein